MFLPPKLIAIALTSLAIFTMTSDTADAQQAEFNRRVAAMQEARARAQQAPQVRTASAEVGVDYAAPPVPSGVRVAQAPPQTRTRQPATRQRMAPASNSRRVMLGTSNQQVQRGGFVPKHTRTAQLMDSTFIDGGSPIVNSQMMGSPVMSSQMMGSPVMGAPMMQSTIVGSAPGCASCGNHSYDGGQMMDGGCSSCGDCGDGSYFDDQCCDRGGCPPGPCWISGLGLALYNGEYFGGATSFRSTLFSTPGQATTPGGLLSNDCSHGFYGGVNFGIPLCKLTCGVFSGQLGVRSVQTNFNGNEFSSNNRDQLFVTAGFYRRVDYGLQAGVVADILHEEWFTNSDLVQIRADLGWVYAGGSTLGFRYATNVQDDVNSGSFAGLPFNSLIQSTDDNYRFYYRYDAPQGGYGEGFVGWSGEGQTVVGLDFDLPVADRVAMQAGFTYFLGDEGVPANSNQLGGNADDAYNLYVGLAFRPRGRSFYRSYDRPLFSVADNGSMLITR